MLEMQEWILKQTDSEWQKCSSILLVAAVCYWNSVPSTVRSYVDETFFKAKVKEKESAKKTTKLAGCCFLPEDILRCIVSYSSAKTIATATATCRRLQALIDTDAIWHILFQRDIAQHFLFNTDCNQTRKPWKLYYSEFALSWVERFVVGANIEDEKVWIGIRGAVYDLTNFVENHPGSPDTLLDFAGTDATELFQAVGHSLDAERIMKGLCLRKRIPTGGALLYHARTFALRRKRAKRAAPSACNNDRPNCQGPAVLANSPRLFFDVDRNIWRCWWPCCGQVVDIGSFSDLPPSFSLSDSYFSSSIMLPRRSLAYARRLLFTSSPNSQAHTNT